MQSEKKSAKSSKVQESNLDPSSFVEEEKHSERHSERRSHKSKSKKSDQYSKSKSSNKFQEGEESR